MKDVLRDMKVLQKTGNEDRPQERLSGVAVDGGPAVVTVAGPDAGTEALARKARCSRASAG